MAEEILEPASLTVGDVAAPEVPRSALDGTDLALIRALLEDSRLSQRQLAVRLSVSAPTVGERMSRLERAGVIRGYTVDIDLAAVGFPQVVYLSIEAVERMHVADIMQKLWALPEMEDVSVVTGDLDLLARLRVRDYGHLRTVLMDTVWGIEGIKSTTTMMTIASMPSRNVGSSLLAAIPDESDRPA